jgi:branched-chain amino acid aminotransferase
MGQDILPITDRGVKPGGFSHWFTEVPLFRRDRTLGPGSARGFEPLYAPRYNQSSPVAISKTYLGRCDGPIGAFMALEKTDKIWHNGKLIRWEDATIHVMSHVVHYGSSVFEGIRCYAPNGNPAIFRADDHMQRLLDSAKIYRMDVGYTRDELVRAMVDVIGNNGIWPCYVRPVIFRGYGDAGVSPNNCPVESYIVNYPWGKYLTQDDSGVDVCVSSWTRIAPNTLPALAKSGANYMNSQLIRMEATANGYVEGIALDMNGYVSEGSGENVFVVRNGVLQTAPLGNSVLPGITRDSVLKLARELGIPVLEAGIPREMLYISDEVFFTGTAAELTPIRSVDRITVGKGNVGPVTRELQREFFAIIQGQKPDRFNWLKPVAVASKQPVGV